MQSSEATLNRLCSVLQSHAKTRMVVTGDTNLTSDLGLDSAQLMEILVEVEDAYDVSIPLNILPNVYTVNDLSNSLDTLLKASE